MNTFFSFDAQNLDLGIASRATSSRSVKVSQVDFNGKLLPEGVSEQSFELLSRGDLLVHRFAYHEEFKGFAQIVHNDLSGNYGTKPMPAPLKKVTEFKTPIASIPETVRNTEKGGKMIDFEYQDIDEATGKVLAEVKELDGKFVKYVYNQPLYKEFYLNSGQIYTSEYKGVIKDTDGRYYKEVFDELNFICSVGIGLFNGVELNENGTPKIGTEGTYMVVGARSDKNFFAGNPGASGVRFTIKSIMKSVLAHPKLGVVKPDIISKGVLPEGKFSVNKGVACAIYNADGEIAQKFTGKKGDPRLGYKLSEFKIKGIRKTTEVENIAVAKMSEASNNKAIALSDLDL